jgi:hypothetical protein
VRRKIGILTLIGIMMFGTGAYAKDSFKIVVNQKRIQADAEPIVVQGRMMVPVRAVAEALGADVSWDPKSQTATIRKWANTAKLTVGQKTAQVGYADNLASTELDTPVKNVRSRV